MKTQKILFALLFCFLIGSVSAQEGETKSSLGKDGQANNIEALLDSQNFEFIATRAFPTTGTPKNLAGNGNSLTFSPDIIISTLPFYGKAYSGMAMQNDRGMRFKGKPENYSLDKKKGFKVNTVVHDSDTYRISLDVNNSGHARLTISSNDRGTISYAGEIVAVSE